MNKQTGEERQAAIPLKWITRNPEVMQGRACIRGIRVTVGMIVGQIGAGRSIENVLDDFPYLEWEMCMKHFSMLPGCRRNGSLY